MTSDRQLNGPVLLLRAGSQPGCLRLLLLEYSDDPAAFALRGCTPVAGGALLSLKVECVGLTRLSEADTGHLLRHGRHLLRPGGEMSLPVGREEGELRREGVEAAAWRTGFDAWLDFVAGRAVLSKPLRASEGEPLVSIVMPTYKAAHLAEALASAQAQTWPHCEIIVCDDSPAGDDVRDVTRASAGPHPVRYHRNPSNLGGRANYHQCFERARGRYIKFLNDDDRLHPGCVARMAAILASRPAVTLVTSYRRLIDEAGGPLPDEAWNTPLATTDGQLDGRVLASHVLYAATNFIGEPTTVMFRKEDMVDTQPCLMSYAGREARRNGDMSIWISLLSRGDAVVLTESLSEFRQHAAQAQRDPDFMAEALLAWDELKADAERTGLLVGEPGADLMPIDLAPQGDLAAGEQLFATGLVKEAAAVFEALLASDPTDTRARGNLACACWAAGWPQRAVLEGLVAHSLAPQDAVITANLQDMLSLG